LGVNFETFKILFVFIRLILIILWFIFDYKLV